MRIEPLGDRAMLLEIDGGIDAATLERVQRVAGAIRAAAFPAVQDVVPGFASVVVHYEPLLVPPTHATRFAALGDLVRDAIERATPTERAHASTAARTVEIPVRYGGAHGPDLEALAARHGLTADAVVALHGAPAYTVHMIGFVPGFPYLGGLDPRLATPRRDSPRARVPGGSVGIGGAQTGVYPIEAPGGWHLIGHTPLRLFDPARARPSLLGVGDRVRFRAVDAREYEVLVAEALAERAAAGVPTTGSGP